MEKFALLLILLSVSAQAAPLAAGTPAKPAEEAIITKLPAVSTLGMRATPFLGLTYSTLVGDNTGSVEPRTGITAGGLFEFGKSNFVAETGLFYRQMGFSDKDDIFKVSINLDYLSIPLIAKYYFNKSRVVSPFFKAGIVPMILVQKSATVNGGGFSGSTSDINVSSSDVGLSVGVGISADMNSQTKFSAEAAYLRGTQRINIEGDGSVYNSGGIISAGISIGL